MSFYIATLDLLPFREHPESFWSEFCIENVSLDDEQPIEIFDSGKYKLLVRTDKDGRIETVIYQSNLEGTFDDFKDEAIREIIKSLNRLEIAFISSVNFIRLHNPSRKTKYENNLTFDKSQETFPKNVIGYAVGGINVPKIPPTASLEKITNVLLSQDNIDEYIDRFLSIKELSTDPVLHLVTLYSLFEYIDGTKGRKLAESFEKAKKLDSNTSLKKVFSSTRHLVAHGFAGGKRNDEKKTAEILKEFLGESDKSGRYTLDRYNESHINLINDVINESQIIIWQYLKRLIGIST